MVIPRLVTDKHQDRDRCRNIVNASFSAVQGQLAQAGSSRPILPLSTVARDSFDIHRGFGNLRR